MNKLNKSQCNDLAQKVLELYITKSGAQNEQDAIDAAAIMMGMCISAIAAIKNKTATIIKIDSSKKH